MSMNDSLRNPRSSDEKVFSNSRRSDVQKDRTVTHASCTRANRRCTRTRSVIWETRSYKRDLVRIAGVFDDYARHPRRLGRAAARRIQRLTMQSMFNVRQLSESRMLRTRARDTHARLRRLPCLDSEAFLTGAFHEAFSPADVHDVSVRLNVLFQNLIHNCYFAMAETEDGRLTQIWFTCPLHGQWLFVLSLDEFARVLRIAGEIDPGVPDDPVPQLLLRTRS